MKLTYNINIEFLIVLHKLDIMRLDDLDLLRMTDPERLQIHNYLFQERYYANYRNLMINPFSTKILP
jgi:hypothetical protein